MRNPKAETTSNKDISRYWFQRFNKRNRATLHYTIYGHIHQSNICERRIDSEFEETEQDEREETHQRKWCSWGDSKRKQSERRRITIVARGSKSSANDELDSSMCETSLSENSSFVISLFVNRSPWRRRRRSTSERENTQISEILCLINKQSMKRWTD